MLDTDPQNRTSSPVGMLPSAQELVRRERDLQERSPEISRLEFIQEGLAIGAARMDRFAQRTMQTSGNIYTDTLEEVSQGLGEKVQESDGYDYYTRVAKGIVDIPYDRNRSLREKKYWNVRNINIRITDEFDDNQDLRTLVTAMLVQMDSRASLNDILEEVMEAEPAGPVLGLHDLSREIRYKKSRAQRFNDEFDVNPIVAEHAREVLDTAVNGGENAHGGLVGALAALEASEHLINHHLSKYVDTQEELVDLKTLCKSLLYVRRTVMDGEDRRDYIGAMLGVFANPNIDDAHSLLELVLETYPEALTPSNIRDIDVTETERQQIILDLAYAERVRKERTLRKLIVLDNLDESQFSAIEKLKSYQEDPQLGRREILEEFGDSLLFVQTTRAKSDSGTAYTSVLRDSDSAPDQVSYVVVKTGEEDVVVGTSYDEELRHHGGGHFGTAANFMLRLLREDIIPIRKLTATEKSVIEKIT